MTMGDLWAGPGVDLEVLAALLSDEWWRLNNLYWVVPKAGAEPVLFRLNPMQEALYRAMWWRNAILKARQHGISTFLLIMALDRSLFNPHFRAGVIAHTVPDARQLFESKVLFPYERLPEAVRALAQATRDREGELNFSNGSSIRVSASFRSGTLDWLHVSEIGKIAAKFPEKAIEIETGAVEAVPLDGFVFYESTAEGRGGLFFDTCETAKNAEEAGRTLTKLDFRFHFLGWFENPEYRLDVDVPLTERMQKYFAELEEKHGIVLDAGQKVWYQVKEEKLKDKMLREHPSTPEEAFRAAVEGAYFSRQISTTRRDGRIGEVPFNPAYPVETWWDIGRDTTAIWFTQTYDGWCHVIDYYQEAQRDLEHFAQILKARAEELGYRYGLCHWPHDMGNVDWAWTAGRTRVQRAQDLGLAGVDHDRMGGKDDGIDAARGFFPHCKFDAVRCDQGLKCLESYRKRWDEKAADWGPKPVHDWASHGADAYQQLAMYHQFPEERVDHPDQVIPSGWVRIAQERWAPRGEKRPMLGMGVAPENGGVSSFTLARRHDGWWFDELLEFDGEQVSDGPSGAGQVIANRRDNAPVHVELVGLGASVSGFLTENSIQSLGLQLPEKSDRRDRTGNIQYSTLDAEVWWGFRELLDPKEDNGIALPPGGELLAELCTPRVKRNQGGMVVEKFVGCRRACAVVYAAIETRPRSAGVSAPVVRRSWRY